MDFPITSLMLEKIVSSMDTNRGEKMVEGTYRALLADALEKIGHRKKARSEYIKASNLLGCDIGRVKGIIRLQMEYEEGLLKFQDQYTSQYPCPGARSHIPDWFLTPILQ